MVITSTESINSFYFDTPYIWYTIATHTHTHIQIQFELYYFHYNICLHTDAIYVLLWNVAVAALGSKSNRARIYVRLSHIVGIESVCGWCVCVCVCKHKIATAYMLKTPINFTIVDNLLSNYMLETWAQLMRMDSE